VEGRSGAAPGESSGAARQAAPQGSIGPRSPASARIPFRAAGTGAARKTIAGPTGEGAGATPIRAPDGPGGSRTALPPGVHSLPRGHAGLVDAGLYRSDPPQARAAGFIVSRGDIGHPGHPPGEHVLEAEAPAEVHFRWSHDASPAGDEARPIASTPYPR
jgi:hypothetical protein